MPQNLNSSMPEQPAWMRADACCPTHVRHWNLLDLTEPQVLVRASLHDLDGPGGDGPGGEKARAGVGVRDGLKDQIEFLQSEN